MQIDFKDNLNEWLYGKGLNTLFKISSFFKRPKQILETLTQDCSECNSPLETYILEKRDDIPEFGYHIVRCNNCKEFNLIEMESGILRFDFGEYETVEILSKEEYDFDQAQTRLEQIKFFRK